MAGQQPILFSGSAADMLKSMGKDVPETKEQSSLEASRAAKAAMEEPCHDPHCTREARARCRSSRALSVDTPPVSARAADVFSGDAVVLAREVSGAWNAGGDLPGALRRYESQRARRCLPRP